MDKRKIEPLSLCVNFNIQAIISVSNLQKVGNPEQNRDG